MRRHPLAPIAADAVAADHLAQERQPSSSVPELEPAPAAPVGDQLVPIVLALRESPFYRPIIASTGQHHRMVHEIFEQAGITVDVTLWAGGRRELNERVSSVMRRFEDFVVEW